MDFVLVFWLKSALKASPTISSLASLKWKVRVKMPTKQYESRRI